MQMTQSSGINCTFFGLIMDGNLTKEPKCIFRKVRRSHCTFCLVQGLVEVEGSKV